MKFAYSWGGRIQYFDMTVNGKYYLKHDNMCFFIDSDNIEDWDDILTINSFGNHTLNTTQHIIWDEKTVGKKQKKVLKVHVVNNISEYPYFGGTTPMNIIINNDKKFEDILKFDIIDANLKIKFKNISSDFQIPDDKLIKVYGYVDIYITKLSDLKIIKHLIPKSSINHINIHPDNVLLNKCGYIFIPFVIKDTLYKDKFQFFWCGMDVLPMHISPNEMINKKYDNILYIYHPLVVSKFKNELIDCLSNCKVKIPSFILDSIFKEFENTEYYDIILDALETTDNVFYTPDNKKLTNEFIGIL